MVELQAQMSPAVRREQLESVLPFASGPDRAFEFRLENLPADRVLPHISPWGKPIGTVAQKVKYAFNQNRKDRAVEIGNVMNWLPKKSKDIIRGKTWSRRHCHRGNQIAATL